MKALIYTLEPCCDYLAAAVCRGNYVEHRLEVHETADLIVERLPAGITHFVYHIDLTYTSEFPADRGLLNQQLRDRGVTVVNGLTQDISKTRLQTACRTAFGSNLLAEQHGDQDELLFVKSVANYGGAWERTYRDLACNVNLCPTSALVPDAKAYLVVPRSRVEPEWWTHPGLTIERYVTNREHRFLRAYFCYGSTVVTLSINPAIIKKMPTGVPREDYFSPSDSPLYSVVCTKLALVRSQLGMDFGTADLVMDDEGGVHIVDVNSTPYWGEAHYLIPDALRCGLNNE